MDIVSVARHASRWAVKHNGGYLGFTASEHEAVSLARTLLDDLHTQGRAGEFRLEGRETAA